MMQTIKKDGKFMVNDDLYQYMSFAYFELVAASIMTTSSTTQWQR